MASIYPQEDMLHDAAHFGGAYVITHISETICKSYFHEELACILAGAAIANAANIGRKAAQGFPHDTERAAISGFLGTVVAGITIHFD